MRSIRLALLIACLALPAQAATLACTVGNRTATLTISAANANRMLAWANAVYAVGPDGQPSADPVLAALNATLLGLKNNVISWEREQARAAVAEPAPIN